MLNSTTIERMCLVYSKRCMLSEHISYGKIKSTLHVHKYYMEEERGRTKKSFVF